MRNGLDFMLNSSLRDMLNHRYWCTKTRQKVSAMLVHGFLTAAGIHVNYFKDFCFFVSSAILYLCLRHHGYFRIVIHSRLALTTVFIHLLRGASNSCPARALLLIQTIVANTLTIMTDKSIMLF